MSLAKVKASNIHYSALICGAACPDVEVEQGGQVLFALAHPCWMLLSLTCLDVAPVRHFSLAMLGCGPPNDPQMLPLLKTDVMFAFFSRHQEHPDSLQLLWPFRDKREQPLGDTGRLPYSLCSVMSHWLSGGVSNLMLLFLSSISHPRPYY